MSLTKEEFDKRLDDLVETCSFEPQSPGSRTCGWCGMRMSNSIHTLK